MLPIDNEEWVEVNHRHTQQGMSLLHSAHRRKVLCLGQPSNRHMGREKESDQWCLEFFP